MNRHLILTETQKHYIYGPSTQFTKSRKDVIAVIDADSLYSLVVAKVAKELQYMAEDCYYPKISDIHKDLLHRSNTTDEKLKDFSKSQFPLRQEYKLLHDPKNTILILLTQEFLSLNKRDAALSCLHLISLRYYTNIMYGTFIKFCNKNYFRTALENLSHNHLFTKKSNIANSLLYLSSDILRKHEEHLKTDDKEEIRKMIYELRHRIWQSVRAFANKYYQAHTNKDVHKMESEDAPYKESLDQQIKQHAEAISKEMCIYGTIDQNALATAQQLTKFNKKIAQQYVNGFINPKYKELIYTCCYLFLKSAMENRIKTKSEYADLSRKLMSIKVSNKPIYFKKSLTQLHDSVIHDIGYSDYIKKISIQSQRISKSFMAYYIALYISNYTA